MLAGGPALDLAGRRARNRAAAEGTHLKESPMTTAQFLYLILVLVAFGGFAAVLAINSMHD
jgi:hypothetical protein